MDSGTASAKRQDGGRDLVLGGFVPAQLPPGLQERSEQTLGLVPGPLSFPPHSPPLIAERKCLFQKKLQAAGLGIPGRQSPQFETSLRLVDSFWQRRMAGFGAGEFALGTFLQGPRASRMSSPLRSTNKKAQRHELALPLPPLAPPWPLSSPLEPLCRMIKVLSFQTFFRERGNLAGKASDHLV